MKALSISRGRLAADLEVDKSVITRWLAGTHTPTDFNLARLTTLIAEQRRGFSMLDWQLDAEALAQRLRARDGEEPVLPAGLAEWLPPGAVKEALAQTVARGRAYEGFWQSTRPSIEAPGRFVHDQLLTRLRADGLLEWRMGVEDLRILGVCLPLQTQLFCMGADGSNGMFAFCILNGVLRNRADVMDGVSLTLRRSAGGAPVAGCIILNRVGAISGDWEADEARHEHLIRSRPALAPEGSIDPELSAHLLRDAGPLALAAGGAALLSIPFSQSRSRGPPADSSAESQTVG